MQDYREIYAAMDPESLRKLTDALNKYPKECANGVVSAINKSLHGVDVELQRSISTRYNITQKELRGGGSFKGSASNNLIREKKANYANLNAGIEVRGSRLNDGARFLNTPKHPKSHKGKTMRQIKKMRYPRVTIIKGKKKPLASWVGIGKGNVRVIFVRNSAPGPQGGMLSVKKTLSIAEMASNNTVWKKTSEKAKKILQEKVAQELRYRMKKLGGKDS